MKVLQALPVGGVDFGIKGQPCIRHAQIGQKPLCEAGVQNQNWAQQIGSDKILIADSLSLQLC